MVPVPKGAYAPFFSQTKGSLVQVQAFDMDRYPVTKAEFAVFLEKHPEWRKSHVKRLFAESHYLENWHAIGAASPVTDVSWFAARAYCQAHGEDLPTTDEWEYVRTNGFGVAGMDSLVWEWTLDFNGESTDDDERSSFCGKGSEGGLDQADSARYMRYAFRSSLRADYAIRDLGFRCVKEGG